MLAVIKQFLCLFLGVLDTSGGKPGIEIKDEDGHFFLTDGSYLWSIMQALHQDPGCWPQPDIFLPERQLTWDRS